MNGAPWETISELFSFVAIQKPTRTQPKVLEFVKCQSINGALACAPQATARQVELRQKCQSINGALACAPSKPCRLAPEQRVSVDQWRAGLRARTIHSLFTPDLPCQSINGALACAPACSTPGFGGTVQCQSINGALACAPYIMQFEWTISIGCQSINGALACAPCRTSTSLPTLVEVSVDQWRAGLRAPAKTLCLL